MKTSVRWVRVALKPAIAGALLFGGIWTLPAEELREKSKKEDRPATVTEARGRARLLHALIHGTLQVVHRDFFDPDQRDDIPSASMENVFDDLEENWGVTIRWLGVEGKTMSVDHKPKDAFERKAVDVLESGKEEYDAVEGNRYRYAGAIVLHNACLKCHVPNRTSLEDRTAGLVISMPFGKE